MFRLLVSQRALHYTPRLWNGKNPFLYTTKPAELAKKVQSSILAAKDVPEQTVLDALKACRELQQQIHEGDKLERDPAGKSVQKQIEAILESENVNFNGDLLKKVFLLNFPSATAVQILGLYYKRNPKTAVEMSTALVPFRRSLFDADLKNALKITDLTTGHPNYIAMKDLEMRRGVFRLIVTAIGITLFSKVGVQQIIESGYLLPEWKHLASLNAMFLTYVFNLSFFVTIVRFGRTLTAAGGDFLTWQKGTFYTHWYKHADEMALCTKIMEADLKLNGGLENSPWLVEELCRRDDRNEAKTPQPGVTRDGHKVRLLQQKDSIEDLKLQAYWMGGGDGFEWVEPDQDPADIVWREHLQKLHSPALKEGAAPSLKWAEQLIEEK